MRARAALLCAAVAVAIFAAFRTCADDAPQAPPPHPDEAGAALREGTVAAKRGPPRARSVSSVVAAAADATPPAPAQDPARDAAVPAAPKPARLTVVVKRSDGRPAAGVRVAVARSDRTGGGLFGGTWDRLPDASAPKTTDAGGRVTFEADHFWIVWALASDGDEAGISDGRTTLRGGEEGTATVTLVPSLRVRGTVQDRDGGLVSHARVRMLVPDLDASMSSSVGPYAWAVDPLSCADGSFEFPAVLPAKPPADEEKAWLSPKGLTIEARADGLLAMRHHVEISDAGKPVTVVLVRTGVVRGRCADSEGRGVAGVAVSRAKSWEERFETRPWALTTGADGRFEFTDFPEVGGKLEISGGGCAPTTADVPQFDPRAGRDVGDIVLATGFTVRGRVVGPDGAPAPGAGVWFGGQGARADADGKFTIEHLPPGPWQVYAQDDAGRRKGRTQVSDDPGDVTIVVRNDRQVRLRIHFAPGSEPPGDRPYLRVRWRKESDPADSRANERPERLDSEIWLQFDASGRWILGVEMDGWEPAETPVEVAVGRAVDAQVTLRKPAR